MDIENFCVTGTCCAYFVNPEFSSANDDTGSQSEIGCLDAPKRIAGGSYVSKNWYGMRGQSTIEREAS